MTEHEIVQILIVIICLMVIAPVIIMFIYEMNRPKQPRFKAIPNADGTYRICEKKAIYGGYIYRTIHNCSSVPEDQLTDKMKNLMRDVKEF